MEFFPTIIVKLLKCCSVHVPGQSELGYKKLKFSILILRRGFSECYEYNCMVAGVAYWPFTSRFRRATFRRGL